MRWDELTGDAFGRAVEAAEGVCLVPLSVVERHGHHLPLGTDMFIGREVCTRAAAREPAIIFPDMIFTQILEARHCPGTIAVEPDLQLRLLESICREIARNGLRKIVLVNAHGGNLGLLNFFGMAQLASPRDYVVYVTSAGYSDPESGVAAQWETTVDGHAGESETSKMLAIRPDLVVRDQIPAGGEGHPLGRLDQLRALGATTGIWWYADHPTHYRGDATPATPEKGERALDACAEALVRAIQAIKQDDEARRLQNEFFGRSEAPR